ncbi:putative sugar O-methyltransferase [bacterium]|nr:putative sugar O-methyltransferase [bacterium]
MRFGPISLVRSASIDKMKETQDFLSEQNAKLSVELGSGSTLHSFMHYPWTAKTAPQAILNPDTDQKRIKEACTRIADAYAQCKKESDETNKDVGHSMWNEVRTRHQEFIQALENKNVDTLCQLLPGFLQSELVWGLGKYDLKLVDDMRAVSEKSHVQLRITDALMSLAQSIGAHPVGSVEQQGSKVTMSVLDTDIEKLFKDVEQKLGFSAAAPEVAANYGCRINNKFVTIDSILHCYSIQRLQQLGATAASNIIEIGGGYGCMAHLAHRAGLKKYSIIDLPWVNALQAYYLLMSLDASDVVLHGEQKKDSGVHIHPYWHFEKIEFNSVDYFFNMDSMPEMAFEACRGYLDGMRSRLKKQSGMFLSINQEAQAPNAAAKQNNVPMIIEELGGYKKLSRHLYWMRQGFVEETYVVDKK